MRGDRDNNVLDTSKENSHTAGQDGFLRDLRRQTTPMGDRLRGPGNSLVAARGHGCLISWRKVLPRSPGRLAVSAGSVSGEAIASVAADGSAKRTGAATAEVGPLGMSWSTLNRRSAGAG
jgi:hypothetical protein